MKSMKSRFLKRFKIIPSIYSTKQQHASSLCCQNLPHFLQQEHVTKTSLVLGDEQDFESRLYSGLIIRSSPCGLEPSNEIDVFEECESEFDTMPEMVSSSSSSSSSSSLSSSCCTSPTREICKSSSENGDPERISLIDFEEKCPPGGSDKVILYTTSLRGVRKTYDDCHAMKSLLHSLRIVYSERDVSMDLEFRDEFWRIIGGRSTPPRLFIKGRHIGGVDEVATLHEVGTLRKLLQGIPVINVGCNVNCRQCGGLRFLVCLECNGSCKIYKGDQANNGRNYVFGKCPKCNENGLIKCPTCS